MEGSPIPESSWRQKALGEFVVSSDESDEETASAQEPNKPKEPCTADTKKDKRGSFWIEETQPIVNEPQVRNQRGSVRIEETEPTVAQPHASDQQGSCRIEEPAEATTTNLPAPDLRQAHANDQNQDEERTSPLDTQLATLNSAFLEAVDATLESDPESCLIPLLKDYLNFTRAAVQGTSETPAVDFKELGNFFEQFDK